MKKRPLMMYTLLFATSSLLVPYELLAGGDDRSPCERTAKQMFAACHADVKDDYKTTLANCTNLATGSERGACREEAKLVRMEEADYCSDQLDARTDACEILDEHRYDTDPLLDPTIAFVDPDDVDQSSANPYVSVVAGHTYVLRAGEEGEETVVVHVTEESRDIQGVLCRVVVDAVVETEEDEATGEIEYLPVEITDDWFAQDTEGNVYYCGEVSRNFEEGVLVDLDGSFESGREFAKAGLLIMAMPEVGFAHRQEFALGEAEDIVQYVDLAGIPGVENENFPCADAGGCLMTYDFAPLEPESTEFKYYIPGIGFVLAEAMEDGELTGETEQLVCVGDSLDILQDPACEIEDPEELLEELCEYAPDAFCD
ncbi:MAG: hypothetical protein G8D61_00015 [gamma proteobacterium symbiont of Ctena orbiculata]|nr:hypothetical protein [Candidatus Thiodiazotropha sp. (ex Lucina pensylvanica)]MBT3064896.1 hypothetical protein [Candidatus Thiodiazotropha sp. (ex Lucina pensylvanica)]MBV2096393.1 hypothetical protein [Candidatus Thiodiazotropha sp. (ex Codakia orbicularis)]